MNCRPGDLAFIARVFDPEDRPFLNKIVRVVNLCMQNAYGDWCWSYEGRRLIDSDGAEAIALPDCLLFPIRDQPGEDETLTWAGKPEGVTA